MNIETNVKNWVVDSSATRHICINKNNFVSYTQVEKEEEIVYLGTSRTVQVIGKDKVLLKLTSGKILALSNVLYVPIIMLIAEIFRFYDEL